LTEQAEVQTATEQSVDWTASLPPDLKPLVETKGWKQPSDALTSYMNLEKALGAEKLPLPPKGSDGARDWSKWDGWNALGRPDSPDKYQIDVKFPDGVPINQDAVKGFLAKAHATGMTQAQAQEALGFYSGFLQTAYQQAEQQAQEEVKTAEATLRKEMGQAYDANLALANRVVSKFGGDELVKALESTGLGRNPALVKAFAAIGQAIAEDGELPGGKPSGAALTPADAQAQINAMHGDPNVMKILMDKQHPEYSQTVAKRDRLYQAAFPDTQ